jgi:repressor LexA
MQQQLNPTQRQIYEYLSLLWQQGERSPSGAELGLRFGMSQQAIWKNLRVLERAGLLERQAHRARSIRPLTPSRGELGILGRIAAGRPIEPVEVRQVLPLESLLPAGESYALEVEGESMIEDGIHPGDLVVVRAQNHARNGQTVVAVVDGEATLKRYYHEGDHIRLQPANANMQPLHIPPGVPFEIRGVVHALVRRFAG